MGEDGTPASTLAPAPSNRMMSLDLAFMASQEPRPEFFDFRQWQVALLEATNQVCDEMTVENRNRCALGVEPAPVCAGQIHEVLQHLLFAHHAFLADLEKLQVRGAGECLLHVWVIGEHPLKPQEELTMAERQIRSLVGHEAVDVLVHGEEAVALVDFDDSEFALFLSSRSFYHGLDYLHLAVLELERRVEDDLLESSSLFAEERLQVGAKFREVVRFTVAPANDIKTLEQPAGIREHGEGEVFFHPPIWFLTDHLVRLADSNDERTILGGFDLPRFAARLAEQLQGDVRHRPLQSVVIFDGVRGANLCGHACVSENGFVGDVGFLLLWHHNDRNACLTGRRCDTGEHSLHLGLGEVLNDYWLVADDQRQVKQVLKAWKVEVGLASFQRTGQATGKLDVLLAENENQRRAGSHAFEGASFLHTDELASVFPVVSDNVSLRSELPGRERQEVGRDTQRRAGTVKGHGEQLGVAALNPTPDFLQAVGITIEVSPEVLIKAKAQLLDAPTERNSLTKLEMEIDQKTELPRCTKKIWLQRNDLPSFGMFCEQERDFPFERVLRNCEVSRFE